MKRKIRNFYRWLLVALKHLGDDPPVYVNLRTSGLRLHIGCGDVNIQGWINIDARSAPHVHLTTDSLTLDSFSDGSIDEIYLCHVLEHFSRFEVKDLMKTFHNKLAPGGLLRISVPSFEALVQAYHLTNDLESMQTALMGGQDYAYNFHKIVFDRLYMTNLLLGSGFLDVRNWSPTDVFGPELKDWSVPLINGKDGAVPLSLNLQATRPIF